MTQADDELAGVARRISAAPNGCIAGPTGGERKAERLARARHSLRSSCGDPGDRGSLRMSLGDRAPSPAGMSATRP